MKVKPESLRFENKKRKKEKARYNKKAARLSCFLKNELSNRSGIQYNTPDRHLLYDSLF